MFRCLGLDLPGRLKDLTTKRWKIWSRRKTLYLFRGSGEEVDGGRGNRLEIKDTEVSVLSFMFVKKFILNNSKRFDIPPGPLRLTKGHLYDNETWWETNGGFLFLGRVGRWEADGGSSFSCPVGRWEADGGPSFSCRVGRRGFPLSRVVSTGGTTPGKTITSTVDTRGCVSPKGGENSTSSPIT